MEACGSAHHWARWLDRFGIAVKLSPAAHIRAYVKRNKTDAADACALLEAARASDIVPVKVKSVEQAADFLLIDTETPGQLQFADACLSHGHEQGGLRQRFRWWRHQMLAPLCFVEGFQLADEVVPIMGALSDENIRP